jgi:hypothetical protein
MAQEAAITALDIGLAAAPLWSFKVATGDSTAAQILQQRLYREIRS